MGTVIPLELLAGLGIPAAVWATVAGATRMVIRRIERMEEKLDAMRENLSEYQAQTSRELGALSFRIERSNASEDTRPGLVAVRKSRPFA